MRVLMVHGRYLIRGGEDEVFEAERRMLQAAGVEVDSYEEDNRLVDQQGRLQTALDTVWSRRCHEAVRARLRAKRADVMHVHNFFPLLCVYVLVARQIRKQNWRKLCRNTCASPP